MTDTIPSTVDVPDNVEVLRDIINQQSHLITSYRQQTRDLVTACARKNPGVWAVARLIVKWRLVK